MPLERLREASNLLRNLFILLSVAGSTCRQAGYAGERTLNSLISSLCRYDLAQGLQDLLQRILLQFDPVRVSATGRASTQNIKLLQVLAAFPAQQRILQRVYESPLLMMGFNFFSIQRLVQLAKTCCLIEHVTEENGHDGGMWMHSLVQDHLRAEGSCKILLLRLPLP